MTIDEARELAARISAVISERDELLEEVQYWRQVVAELESLRQFLDEDSAAAITVNGAVNGHLASARGYAPTEASPIPDSPTPPTAVKPEEPSSAEDAGVVNALLQNPLVQSDVNSPSNEADQAAPAVTPKSKTLTVAEDVEPQGHTGETVPDVSCEPNTPESHAGGMAADDRQDAQDASESQTGEVPASGTLLSRIVDVIAQSDRPKRPWQIQKVLGLARLPSAELSRLVAQGALVRVREGVYGMPGRDYGGSNLLEGDAL